MNEKDSLKLAKDLLNDINEKISMSLMKEYMITKIKMD